MTAAAIDRSLNGKHTFSCALSTRGAACDCWPEPVGSTPSDLSIDADAASSTESIEHCAICDFAGDSRHANPWAADLYQRARARGHDHPHAVRVLARAWVDIIWACWTTHTPYDPNRHGALQRIHNQDQPAAA